MTVPNPAQKPPNDVDATGRCMTCGAPIEHFAGVPGSEYMTPFWRHIEPPAGALHPAVPGQPATTEPEPVEDIRCSCGDEPDPNCRWHGSRFRRPCGEPDPHHEHPWTSPAILGSAPWVCPGVLRPRAIAAHYDTSGWPDDPEVSCACGATFDEPDAREQLGRHIEVGNAEGGAR